MTHDEIIELLPWYANRTLDPNEEREVAAHLNTCAPCSRELEQFRSIQLAVSESAEEIPEPSKDMFRRAMGEIQHHEQTKAESANAEAGFTSLLSRLGELLFGWIGPAPVFARAVVAAQFLVVVALAGALGLALFKGGDYQTASGPGPERGSGTTLAVKFAESATEAELRRTVTELSAKIVDGPSALGIYKIEVPIDPKKSEAVERVIQQLRNNGAVISYAERSDP